MYTITIPVPTMLLYVSGVMALVLIIKFVIRFVMG